MAERTPEQLNNLIDKVINLPSDKLESIADKFAETLARSEAKEKDKEALELGLERLTIFFKGGKSGLLVKANELTGMTLLNLHGSGVINVPSELEISYRVTNNFNELFRLTIEVNGMIYWNDLIDEQMAIEVAEFVGVEVELQA